MLGPRRVAVAFVALTIAAACTEGPEPVPGPPPGSRTIDAMAEAVGADVLSALHRGYYAEVSADIALVPEPYNVVVRWSGVGLGTDDADPSTTHPTPWSYHQRVPLLFYPGAKITEGHESFQWSSVTGVASVSAELLGLQGFGRNRWFFPPPPRPDPLKAIVVVVYDGGGWNLLEQWPNAWPVLRRLMEDGYLFQNANIGSAPAVTSAIHANIGTGTYPSEHGVSEITGRLPDGSVGDVFFEHDTDPRLLLEPTVGDEWDLKTGNQAWVGMIGFESWHLGMMSHGAQWPGGDRDVAVLWNQDEGIGEFFTNEELYELPDYLPDAEELQARLDAQDAEDGALDGTWNGFDLQDPKVVPATPAFVEHQGEALLEMMKREPFGDDEVTDLLYVELKPTDFGGHLWNMVAPEEEEVLRAQDQVLGDIVETLNREVGTGAWTLAFTADHGQTPLPETTGGLRIHPDILGAKVDAYFGRKIVQKVTPDGMFLDHEAMEAAGITFEDVARFVGDYRYGDGLPTDADRSQISHEDLDRRVFAAAFPGEYLGALEPGEMSVGRGDYRPEGDLSRPFDPPLR